MADPQIGHWRSGRPDRLPDPRSRHAIDPRMLTSGSAADGRSGAFPEKCDCFGYVSGFLSWRALGMGAVSPETALEPFPRMAITVGNGQITLAVLIGSGGSSPELPWRTSRDVRLLSYGPFSAVWPKS